MSTASAYRSYIGATTTTLLPLAANAAGKAPHTSPKPPVLDHGETSAVTKTIGHALVHGSRLPVQREIFIPPLGRIAADGGEEAEDGILRPVEDVMDDDVVLFRRGLGLHGRRRRLIVHRSLGDGVGGIFNRGSPVYPSVAEGNSDTRVCP